MAVRFNKRWQALTRENVSRLACHMGVYQLADGTGAVTFIGVAGGSSPFGLRGELESHLTDTGAGTTQFRFEITTAYHSRFRELVQVYLNDHGHLPSGNQNLDASAFGRVRPEPV